jgi:hypothetical protein
MASRKAEKTNTGKLKAGAGRDDLAAFIDRELILLTEDQVRLIPFYRIEVLAKRIVKFQNGEL